MALNGVGSKVSEKERIQEIWSLKICEALEPIAADNPYLPDVVGEEIDSLTAVAWTRGAKGAD